MECRGGHRWSDTWLTPLMPYHEAFVPAYTAGIYLSTVLLLTIIRVRSFHPCWRLHYLPLRSWMEGLREARGVSDLHWSRQVH